MAAPLPTPLDRTGQDGRAGGAGQPSVMVYFGSMSHGGPFPCPLQSRVHLQNPLRPDSAERHQAEATSAEMGHLWRLSAAARTPALVRKPQGVLLRRSHCPPALACCHTPASGDSVSWPREVRLLDREAGTGMVSPGTSRRDPGAPPAGSHLSRDCSSAAFPG